MDIMNLLFNGVVIYLAIYLFIRYFIKLNEQQFATDKMMMLAGVILLGLTLSRTCRNRKEDFQTTEPTSSPSPITAVGTQQTVAAVVPEGNPVNTTPLSAADLASGPAASMPGSVAAPIGGITAGGMVVPAVNGNMTYPALAGAEKPKQSTAMDLITEENSPLLNQDKDLNFTLQFDKSNKIDTIGSDAQFSLNCNSTYSSGSQGFICLSESGQKMLDTRGGNRGPKPIGGEL